MLLLRRHKTLHLLSQCSFSSSTSYCVSPKLRACDTSRKLVRSMPSDSHCYITLAVMCWCKESTWPMMYLWLAPLRLHHP